ncbi:MAG: PAS domain S-box protein, partial [Candidatus Sericytochromatia bacterium]
MKSYEDLLKKNESLIKENLYFREMLSSKDTNELLEKELTRAIPDAFFLLDKKGNFLKFIPAKDFDFYVQPEVFLGKNIKDIFSEELSNKFFAHFENLFETNETQIIEYELEGKYFEARFVISGNDNVLSVVRDITINKKAYISTKKYNDLIEKAPFGFAYHKIILDEFDKPIDYEFLEVNETFELMTGLKKSDVINCKITDVIQTIKEDSFNWIDFYGDTALNGTEKDFEQYSEALKRWYKVKVYSTEKYHFATLFEDITERKLSENKLNNERIRLKTLLETIPDMIWLKDINGVYLSCNSKFEDFFGSKEEEIIG